MLQFNNPMVLLLLWLVPVLPLIWLYVCSRSEKRLEAFIAGVMQQRLRRPTSPLRQRSQAWLAAGGVVLLIIAAAGPRWGSREAPAVAVNRDVVLLLDVSRSMLAADTQPSRLQRAKADMRTLVEELDEERIALVAFRSDGVLLCPLTRDHRFLDQVLEDAGPASAPRGGTDIGAGIRTALTVLAGDGPGHGVVVLFSDGEDLAGTLGEALRRAAEKEIRVIAVGLGSGEGAGIPGPGVQAGAARFEGRDVVTRRQDGAPRAIAAATGGAYVPGGEEGGTPMPVAGLCAAYLREISEHETRERLMEQSIQRYQGFLLPGLLCLIAVAWLARQKRNEPGKADAERGTRNAERGTDALSGKPLQRAWIAVAACLFVQTARGGSPTVFSNPPPDLPFNVAAQAFAAGAYRQAADILSGLPGAGPGERVRNEMALGCSLFRLAESMDERDVERLEERADLFHRAAGAFLAVARAEPGNGVARTNLTVALLAFQAVSAQRKEAKPEAAELPGKQTEPPQKATPPEAAATGRSAPADPGPAESSPEADKAAETAPALTDSDIRQIMNDAVLREEKYRADRQQRLERLDVPFTGRDW